MEELCKSGIEFRICAHTYNLYHRPGPRGVDTMVVRAPRPQDPTMDLQQQRLHQSMVVWASRPHGSDKDSLGQRLQH
jgi:hypothetical protein